MQTIGYKSNADVGMKRGETISLVIAKLNLSCVEIKGLNYSIK